MRSDNPTRWLRNALATIGLLYLGSCAHGLQPCQACGPGFLCQESEVSGITFNQCYRHCKADTQCPASWKCNCDADACTIHSGEIPMEVCVAPGQRVNNPALQEFFPQQGEQLSCSTCSPNEVCLNVGQVEQPDFKCFKQCTFTQQCPKSQICNCGIEKGGLCRDDYPQNVCMIPPTPK